MQPCQHSSPVIDVVALDIQRWLQNLLTVMLMGRNYELVTAKGLWYCSIERKK